MDTDEVRDGDRVLAVGLVALSARQHTALDVSRLQQAAAMAILVQAVQQFLAIISGRLHAG